MAKKIVVGHIVYNIGGESRELDVALTNSKKKTSDFTKFIKSAAGIGGAVIAFRSLIRIGKDLLASYAQQEQAEAGLAAAIRATGGDVEELMPRYGAFASQIQRVTTIGDEAALGLLKQARSFGIADDRMEEATRGAIGLSKAFGLDMDTALRGVALAYEGNFSQLSRYIPALRTAKTDAERMAIVQRNMAAGFSIAEAEAGTGAGTMIRLGNAFGDLKEIGGQLLSETLVPLLDFMLPKLQELAAWITEMRERSADWAGFERGEGLASVGHKARQVEMLTQAHRGAVAWLTDLKAQEQEYVDKGRRVPESLKKKITEVYNLIAQIQKNRRELAALIPAEEAEKKARDAAAEATRKAAEAERKLADERALAESLAGARWAVDMELLNAQVANERQAIVDLNNFRLAQQDARLAAEKAAADERVRIEQDAQAKIEQAQSAAMDFLVNIWGQLDSLNQARLGADLAAVESRKQEELANFEGTEEEKQALVAEFEKEKAKLEYESALKSWKLQLAGAVAALARSILEAAKNAWPIPALPMMALATAMGGIQLAALKKAKPVPSFAEGADFVVPPGFDNDTFPMNVESGERVTVTPAGAAPAPMMERPLVLTVDGTPIYRGLLRATQNGIALVAGRAVI